MTTKTKGRPRGAVLRPQAPNVPVSDALSRGLQRVAKELAALAAGVVRTEAPADAEPEPERVQAPPREAVAGLSKVEQRVLGMHKRGKTNPEIAAAVNIRDRDVSAIVRRAGLKAHRRPLPPMTTKEAQEITKQAKAGKTVQEIARATGRPEGTVFLLLHGHHRLSKKPAQARKAKAAAATEAPKTAE